jgi:hypothetical protein
LKKTCCDNEYDRKTAQDYAAWIPLPRFVPRCGMFWSSGCLGRYLPPLHLPVRMPLFWINIRMPMTPPLACYGVAAVGGDIFHSRVIYCEAYRARQNYISGVGHHSPVVVAAHRRGADVPPFTVVQAMVEGGILAQPS